MNAPLRVRDWGGAGGDPLILLHGFMGRSDDWAEVAPRLARGRRVLGFDLPGHGSSLGLAAEAYGLEGAALAVVETVDALGLERVAIAGYSMGGRIAAHVALAAPDRTKSLVLESAHPGFASRGEREARLELDRARARWLQDDAPGFLEAWYRLPLFGLGGDDQRRTELARDRLRADPDELARALVGMSTGRQQPLGERLRALGVPTLLVAGERDSAYVRMLGRLALEGGFDLHVEPGAAHMVHLDRPDAFAALVTTFLERKHPAQHDPD